MKIRKILTFFAIISIVFTLSYSSVNKSVYLKEGTKSSESLSSVNGSIEIGDDCTVNGSIKNVNGSVRLGDNSITDNVSSVNGSIKIGKNVRINGVLKSVNGSIKCYSGTVVKKDIETVNGSVKLHGTEVDGSIITVNGHLKLADTIIGKDIVIKKSNSGFFDRFFRRRKKALRIRLTGNSIVKGDIVNKDKERDVILDMETGCKVEGKLINIDKEK